MKIGICCIAAIVITLSSGAEAVFPQDAKPAASESSPIDLSEIPHPSLSTVDPPVQEQIKDAQAGLASVMSQQPGASNSKKADAFGTLGETYQAYEFVDAAVACYRNAMSLDPQAFRWPYYLGYLHQRTGENEIAVHEFERALAVSPGDKSAMLRLANAGLGINDVDQSKNWFTKVLSAQDRPPAALYGLGKVALIEHQYSVALKFFKEALEREPQASSIHYQLAMTYRGLGDTEQMQRELQLRGDVEPAIKDPYLDEISLLKQGKVALLERGIKAVHENRLKDAVDTYQQIAKLYPNDPIVRTYLAVALAKSGQPDEALEQYSTALQINPENATVHYDVGILLVGTRREEQAIGHFREAVRIDPGLVAAHFQLANLLMRRKRDEEAAQEYGLVVSLQPQNGFARLMQAMAAIRLGAYGQAKEKLNEATAALPRDSDIANALARLLAAAPDASVRDEKRALNIIGNLVQHQQG
ncbi:MAG TPA: tetratricopeptide repeat protein, partial [Candidatus Sulfotelmatobacter sp.]|nr:tetratricopeptide repeat protein [Candidatus Sulfotelmatobacter sp.]